MPLLKRLLYTFCIGVITFSIIQLQNYPIYFDASITQSYKPSSELQTFFNNQSSPIKITIFSSNQLIEELGLSTISYWLSSLSESIQITQIDPIKNPAKSDHYDITSDGTIVIEFQSKRFDIDFIELVLNHTNFSYEILQNHLVQAILNMIQSPPKRVLLLHSSPTSLIQDDRPLGLSTFNQLLINNNIQLIEESTSTLSDLIPGNFDTVIFFKIGLNAYPQIQKLLNLKNTSRGSIIFSHPKYATVSNKLTDLVVFNPTIVNDNLFHLMDSKNQLIVDYTTSFNESLIGVFPYSGFINFDGTQNITAVANSSDDSYVILEDHTVEGPFTIIAKSNTNNTFFINNHLLITNYWIHQANNIKIVEDIIFSTLNTFPIITSQAFNDSFIPTYGTLFKLVIYLIFVPFIIIAILTYLLKETPLRHYLKYNSNHKL